MSHWIRQYGGSLFLLVLAFAYITRLYNLHIPETYMFDEVYHAVTAKLIAKNDPSAFEWWNPPPEPDTAVDWLHPPLAKYFQAASIIAFGENSFGWRFSSVVFGMLVIVLVYHLTMALFNNHAHAVGAAALASLDGLLLVQSRIAMNDIFVTFFILLALLLYVKFRKYRQTKILLLVGIAVGLAIASKWSGVFILAVILTLEMMHVSSHLTQNNTSKVLAKIRWRSVIDHVCMYGLAFFVIPISIYVFSYSQMFLQGKNLAHFKELHNQIWYYQTHLDATHPYQSRPWQWALNMRPVWYHVEYQNESRSDVYAFGNPALFWLGIGAVSATLAKGVLSIQHIYTSKLRIRNKLHKVITSSGASPLFMLIIAYGLVWIPWQLSPRIMFFYHYTPAVPFLCIILAYWLRVLFKNNHQTRLLAVIMWSSIILSFMFWYPQWVGIAVSNTIKDSLYFAVPSWK